MMSSRTIIAIGAALSICIQPSLGQVTPTNPGNCGTDHGKYRTTPAGTFLITCNMRIGQDWMTPKEDVRDLFAACIDACASKPDCEAVDYNQATKSCGYIGKNSIPGLPYEGVNNARKATQASQGRPKPVPKPVDPVVDPVKPEPKPDLTKPDSFIPDDKKQKPIDPDPNGNPVYTEKALCLKDHGKIFITNDGTAYKLQCAHLAPGTSKLGQATVETSFAACMEKCSSNTQCNSVQFAARPDKPDTPPSGTCTILKESLEAKTQDAQFDYAVQVVPPAHEEDEAPNMLCSTECPFADGMTYASSYGEVFKMDCGKRHGTKVLMTQTAETFQDCMELCGAMVACHSVDYQEGKQKCFFGSHHGRPIITASSYMSAHSIGCAGACGGGGCCSANTANRKSPSTEPSPFPDTSCGNDGLEYALYPNQVDGKNLVYIPPNNGNFNPTVFKTVVPYFTSSTTKIGIKDSLVAIYDGNKAKDGQYVVANHRGYLYTQQAGEYTFASPGTDDVSLLWLGDKAYTGWTRANADLDQAYITGGVPPKSLKATYEKGKYIPIRMIWANSGGAGWFIFKITAPDGTVVVDDKTVSCPHLVRFGCKKQFKAPEHLPWGAET